jgi:putative phosphoribosyl transferase
VLKQVKRPVLLSVGGLDMDVITLNKKALAQMRPDPPKALVVVPGASHLFEESGALEKAAQLARDWFQQYLPGGEAARPG